MKKQKIVVVVPAYNEQAHIAQFLTALQHGARQPDAIVLVDNNSRDQTKEIAKKFPHVTVLREARQGICYAVTTGYDYAFEHGADIVCRSDADALPAANWLKDVEQLLAKNPDVVAVTGSQTVYDANPLVQYYCLALDKFIAISSRLLMKGTIFLRGTNVAFRASAWPDSKKLLVCREDLLHEDMDLSLALRGSGEFLFSPALVMPVARRTFIKPPLRALRYIKRWLRIVQFA